VASVRGVAGAALGYGARGVGNYIRGLFGRGSAAFRRGSGGGKGGGKGRGGKAGGGGAGGH
jgi:hypothetical protein